MTALQRAARSAPAQRAHHDALTGLGDRALLYDRLEDATTRAARDASAVALLLVDVDRFHAVNDVDGHVAGDDLLRAVARCLTRAVRPSDTLARFGADEFAIVAELGGEDEAGTIVQALLAALRAPTVAGDGAVPVRTTVSIGVVVTRDPATTSPDILVRDAGSALSVAKGRGGDHVEIFRPSMVPGPGMGIAPTPVGDAATPATEGSTMTLRDAADLLGVSGSTVRRWADRDRLRVVRTVGGHRRFAASDVRGLKRRITGGQGAVLRRSRLPDAAIPALAALIEAEGAVLLRRAAALLYEPGRDGWFVHAESAAHLEAWRTSLRAGAAGVISWNAVFDATHVLSAHSTRRGAGYAEGHALLERLGDLLQRRLRQRDAPRDAQLASHVLLRALRRAMVDGPPPPPDDPRFAR